jgi:TolB-like protein
MLNGDLCRRVIRLAAITIVMIPGARPARAALVTAAAADSIRIGVVPFVVDAADTLLAPLAYGLPDLLTTDLARSRQLVLVVRSHLATILRELDLARPGGVQQAGAPRFGRLVQAERLVTGSIRLVDANTIVFSVQINDVETGQIVEAVSSPAPLNDLLIAEKEVVLRIFGTLGVLLTPQERARVDQTPTKNLAALLAYSQGVKAEVNGQYALALRRFRAAGRLDPAFKRAMERQQEIEGSIPNFATFAALEVVNRPLESIPVTLTRGLATDPALPAPKATLIVNISRP